MAVNRYFITDAGYVTPPAKKTKPAQTRLVMIKTQLVTVTHKPSGYCVTCGSERSIHVNRERAIKELEFKLTQPDIKIGDL